jgi:hypothetical protein
MHGTMNIKLAFHVSGGWMPVYLQKWKQYITPKFLDTSTDNNDHECNSLFIIHTYIVKKKNSKLPHRTNAGSVLRKTSTKPSNTTIYLVFCFPYFNGYMYQSCRPSSGHPTETELEVHAEELCSIRSHNTYSYIEIYVNIKNCVTLSSCVDV